MKSISNQNNHKRNIFLAILLSILIHIPFMLFFFDYKPVYHYGQNYHPKTIDLIDLKSESAHKSIPAQNTAKPPNDKKEYKKLKKQSAETLIPSSAHEEKSDTLNKHNLPVASELSNSISDTVTKSVPPPGDQNMSRTAMHSDTIIDAEKSGIKPQKLYAPAPSYPPIAQDLGISGIVRVLLTIDTSGMVKEIKIVNSPHSSMSEEVVRTLKKWKFKPVKYNGQKVIIRQFVQEIEFKE